MSNDDGNSEITRNHSRTEPSTSELVTPPTVTPSKDTFAGIHKFTVTAVDEGQSGSSNETTNKNLDVTSSTSTSNSNCTPGTSAPAANFSPFTRTHNVGICSFTNSEISVAIESEVGTSTQNGTINQTDSNISSLTQPQQSSLSNINAMPASISEQSSHNLHRSLINSPRSSRSSTIPAPHQHPLSSSKGRRCYRIVMGHDNEIAIPSTITPPRSRQALPSFDEALRDGAVNITPPPVTPRVQHGPPPLAGAPPSYSAVMRIGSTNHPLPQINNNVLRIQPSPPFIAPIPPPTYSQAQGFQVERPVIIASVDQMVFGPNPLSVICPRCAHVVVTSTQSHRSNLTHFSALALCLCGCWPCCLLPYCMDTCKNTYHHCPSCHQFLGMYRPW